jgi:hypothetical protein
MGSEVDVVAVARTCCLDPGLSPQYAQVANPNNGSGVPLLDAVRSLDSHCRKISCRICLIRLHRLKFVVLRWSTNPVPFRNEVGEGLHGPPVLE